MTMYWIDETDAQKIARLELDAHSYRKEIASLKSQLAEAQRRSRCIVCHADICEVHTAEWVVEVQMDRKRLIDVLRFYSDTSGLLQFVRIRENDPYLNPDGPPDAYGLSDELCVPAREAIAAMSCGTTMEAQKNG